MWCNKGSPKKQIGNCKWLDGHQGDKYFQEPFLNGLKPRKKERITNVNIVIDINVSMLALLCSREGIQWLSKNCFISGGERGGDMGVCLLSSFCLFKIRYVKYLIAIMCMFFINF
jgi:hypothetical protein